jgi:hypothetical protein
MTDMRPEQTDNDEVSKSIDCILGSSAGPYRAASAVVGASDEID